MWADTTWAGATWAGDNEVIGILGESLIVFCVVFVSIVGVIKLAERSVDVARPPPLGGHETDTAREMQERGQVAPQHLAAMGARRRGPHDERSPAARARPESHGAPIQGKGSTTSGMRRSSSFDAMCSEGDKFLRHSKSYGAGLDSIVEASPDAQHLAAMGARRRGPHDERSPAARARPESHGKSREGSTTSGRLYIREYVG